MNHIDAIALVPCLQSFELSVQDSNASLVGGDLSLAVERFGQ